MKRSRGRSQSSNMNRRGGQNNLSRTYESNGPDTKVRGTAPQIAEKYTQLWRDALSSGDMVGAENYLQHAEHYNRIVASFQPVQTQASYNRNDDDTSDENDGVEEGEEGVVNTEREVPQRQERSEHSYSRQDSNREYTPRDNRRDNRDHRDNRNEGRGPRDNRYNRDRDQRPDYNNQPREVRPARSFEEETAVEASAPRQNDQQRQSEPRQDNRQRYSRDNGEGRENRQPRQRLPRGRYNNNDDADLGELPSFITGGSSASAAPLAQDVSAVTPVTPVTPLSVVPDHGDDTADTHEVAAAPRRRYKPRTTAVAGDEGDVSPAAEKRAPRRRAAPARKENIEAE